MATNSSQFKLAGLSPGQVYAALAGVIGLWLCWDAFVFQLVTYSPYADYWEHSALLTEWLRNFPDPINPHVLSDDLSPRFMPWYFVLTAFGRLFGLDAVTLLGISGVVSYAMIVVGIKLFFTQYFRNAWAPAIGFVVLFFGWGVSWNWSNLYQLRSFFYVAGFPSSFVFGLSLLSFWYTVRVCTGEARLQTGAPILLVLAAMMFLCHPLTGVFGIAGCGVLALTVSGVAIQRRLVICVALFLGSLAVEFWPYFSVWEVTLGTSGSAEARWATDADVFDPIGRLFGGEWMHIFYTPKYLAVILGSGLLCVLAWFYLLAKRREPFILLGGAAMLLPYVAHLFIPVPLAHRFLLFAMFFFHMAGVRVLLDLLTAWQEQHVAGQVSPRLQQTGYFVVGFLAFLAVFNVVLLGADYTGRHLSPKLEVVNKFAMIPEGNSVVELYDRLTQDVGPEDVVLSTSDVSWPLPTVRGKAVSIYHQNPVLLDQFDRAADVGEFFTLETTSSRREEILAEYQVRFVLIKTSSDVLIPETFTEWLGNISEPVASVGNYTMYRLKPGYGAATSES